LRRLAHGEDSTTPPKMARFLAHSRASASRIS
jgi:hypothetical protein